MRDSEIDTYEISKNLDEIIASISNVFNFFKEVRTRIPLESNTHSLTYESAISYFVEERPDNSMVSKGALVRQIDNNSKKITIIQIFLDERNKLVFKPNGEPYGRRLLVSMLDEELEETFGDEDLIIVE